ncbi:MAG: helix-turn-helix domain-containing protein [Clostridia bacterium]|nr:helix-turn-helix domain-containing protein [Clostridia bacterium]
MDTYITAQTIKRLREDKGLTQTAVAELIGVSSKAVSKWETSKGLPDISLIEPLSQALGVSVMELMSGDTVINKNTSANILFSKFYVCPVCGKVIHTTGATLVRCCGITLPTLEAEEIDDDHAVTIEPVEDEKFITVHHSMSKSHFISFMAYVTSDRVQFIKLYPESNAETRMQFRGRGYLYLYCNKHGLMKMKV